jgi:hypothetical protein
MIVSPIGAIVESRQTIYDSSGKLSKRNCLLQISSHACGLEVLSRCQSNYKQNRTKEIKLKPSQLLPTKSYIVVI